MGLRPPNADESRTHASTSGLLPSPLGSGPPIRYESRTETTLCAARRVLPSRDRKGADLRTPASFDGADLRADIRDAGSGAALLKNNGCRRASDSATGSRSAPLRSRLSCCGGLTQSCGGSTQGYGVARTMSAPDPISYSNRLIVPRQFFAPQEHGTRSTSLSKW